MNELSSPTAPTTHASGLGERLRSLRLASGLTQTELAGERFSKEYVSQIERGKTRPTKETVEWLAQRLGVDASFLANGVSVANSKFGPSTMASTGQASSHSPQ